MSLGLVAIAGPLVDYTDRAARDLRMRTPYIQAVLPEGEYPADVYNEAWGERDGEG